MIDGWMDNRQIKNAIMPLVCLPAPSPRKRGEVKTGRYANVPSPRLRGEGQGDGAKVRGNEAI